jgi:RNA-directed DNA polymerase
VPWRKLERHVFRIQKRIYRASQHGKQRAVQKLQKLLLKSEAARMLAVRQQRAQEEKGAGAHGVRRQLAGSEQIRPRRWRSQHPVARIVALPDRAQQALVRIALEPAWEARFASESAGCRPGRFSCDALSAIREAMRGRDSYVLAVDLHGCLAIIDRGALLCKLQAVPAVRRAVKAWLSVAVDGASALTGGRVERCAEIAPFLVDVALHGLATHLAEACRRGGEDARVVQYADTFVVLHPTLAGVRRARTMAQAWLQESGLALQTGQATIAHTLRPYQGKVGFDFLGWTVRQCPVRSNHARRAPGLVTSIRPTRERVLRHMQAIKRMINANVAVSQETLIRRLNPMVWAWAADCQASGATEGLAACDHRLCWLLWRWARRRHPNKGWGWVRERYWRRVGNRQWAFGARDGTTLRLHSQTGSRRRVQAAGPAPSAGVGA